MLHSGKHWFSGLKGPKGLPDFLKGRISGGGSPAKTPSPVVHTVAPTTGGNVASYTGGFTTGSAKPEDIQKYGLGTAKNIAAQRASQQQVYPADITGQLQGPATGEYYTHQAMPELQQVGGIAPGGYQAVQSALETPIMQQAQRAQTQIGDIYSGRGLYGSSGSGMQSQALADQNLATQQALAGAVTKRYDLEMADRAARRQEALNQYKAGYANVGEENLYNQQRMAWDLAQEQARRDFANQQLERGQQYGLNRQAWEENQREIDFQRMMQLAGMGSSGAATQAGLDAAREQAEAASSAGMWSGIGSLAGGFLGAPTSSGGSVGGDLASGTWDAISSLWG